VNAFLGALRTAIDAGVIVVLAGMGELLTERVGVLNLGQEGLIGVGAIGAVVAADLGAGPWVAFLVGMTAAALFGLLFAASGARPRVDRRGALEPAGQRLPR
jgi:general nucleoside transport system permease protein